MTRTTCSFGIHLPPGEHDTDGLGMRGMAALVDRRGFESLWVSDHTVLIEEPRSRYPFSESGEFYLPADSDWYDWVVALSFLAAATTTTRLGVAVAVIPHRHPILLAKQLATLDRLSGGRVSLGAGAGWLAEEFDALGVPFAARGKRMDATIDLMRATWTGAPPPGEYGPFTVPPGVRTHPTPVQERVPILIGGESPAALRRAASRGDGWFGTIAGGRMEPERLREVVATLRAEAAGAGKDPHRLDITLRIAARAGDVFTPAFEEYLRDLVESGATRLTFDLGWRSASRSDEILHRLRELSDAF
ncbi:LLM class F420-dependent oxidoreductase [Nonomuraea sp. C10]|uniref:LLM class F420-dependent oxidoreductase n=1 Tax=Nonomuraea sp. C10 TaxID=2600577 RepID=UPI0011CEB51D|nr:LLM class F420-dependent oxidoreductase [Nonomuraea sp. C10]TXK42611.1 LLM class F420-dependent oxidoreductase [Nonomuraea sp. C10]